MNVPIPADADNFLRRECPTCEQQFKWHLGPINDDAAAAPPPSEYYCPICGQPAPPDQWWTREQIAYAQARVMPGVLERLANQTGLQIDAPPDVPATMTEPNDMNIVVSPCHSYEPIKVPDDHGEPIYCLVCGEPFAV